ncbi:CLaudin-like in Caenorhabditis [Aphelenchoides fujianensis]|nr:CLaudin-like in Caenorhabditis [Aphelenchoides fujianensis]
MASTTITQTALLVASVVLIVVGMCLTIAGAFSPAWQVVEIREFLVEHQHGLWWDCVREERHVVAVGDFYDETPLHCWVFAFGCALFTTYKFMAGDNADESSLQFEHQDPLLDKPRMHHGEAARWNRQDFPRTQQFTPQPRVYRETTA